MASFLIETFLFAHKVYLSVSGSLSIFTTFHLNSACSELCFSSWCLAINPPPVFKVTHEIRHTQLQPQPLHCSFQQTEHALITFFLLVRQQEECHRNEYQYTLTNFCTDYEGQKVLYKKMIHISHWLNDWFRGKTGFQIYHFWLHYHIPHDFPFPKMYNTCMPPNFYQLWYQWADLLNVYR